MNSILCIPCLEFDDGDGATASHAHGMIAELGVREVRDSCEMCCGLALKRATSCAAQQDELAVTFKPRAHRSWAERPQDLCQHRTRLVDYSVRPFSCPLCLA